MNAKKYTKKPVTIEALQWTGENVSEIFEFCSMSYRSVINPETGEMGMIIQTLEGPMTASIGDYIIKGIKGEFYPCKPDIFALTYDEATKTEAKPGKSLHNTTANGAKKNVKDIQFWGDGDTFRLISKASSESEGWMKSTKAMPAGNSVVVQVTTQQRNPDGSYSIGEALTTVPDAIISEYLDADDKVVHRTITQRAVIDAGKVAVRHKIEPITFAEDGSK